MSEFSKESVEKLNQLGYEMHKDTKGIVHADVMTKEYVNPSRKGVVSLDPKAAGIIGRELTDVEKQSGTCYVMTEQGVVTNPEEMPTDLPLYIIFRNQVAADKGNNGKSPAAKSEEKSQVPAIRQNNAPAKAEQSTGLSWGNPVGELPKEAFMTMAGKTYILAPGLRFLGRKAGASIKVKMVHYSFQKSEKDDLAGIAIAEATVTLPNGQVYTDIGIAHPDNAGSMIYGEREEFDKKTNTKIKKMVNNLDQLASTRASNRALRLALANGYCSVEELPDVPQEVIEAEGYTTE
jgi:hypothetical protein